MSILAFIDLHFLEAESALSTLIWVINKLCRTRRYHTGAYRTSVLPTLPNTQPFLCLRSPNKFLELGPT